MNRLGARFWLLILSLAAVFASTAWGISNWRELRDGWRIARVKGQPGYAELKARWQKIAAASETLQWPREETYPKQQDKLLGALKREDGKWPGAVRFYEDLKLLTNMAEIRAREDFTGRCCHHMQKSQTREGYGRRAIAELVGLRASGRLSEATFERAILVIVGHDGYFLDSLAPESQRAAALLLCDLVGDGGPPVIRPPAKTLTEAISDAARTRRAEALCMTRKIILRYCREPWSGERLIEKELGVLYRLPLPAIGGNEREAFTALEGLTACTTPLPAWHVDSGGVVVRLLSDLEETLGPPYSAQAVPRHGTATDPGWHARAKDAAGALAGCDWEESGKLHDIGERLRSDAVSRERLVELIQAEAERLPAELRAPYFSVLRWLFADEMFARTVANELAKRPGRSDGPASPSLRLAAEIIRTWS